MKGAAPRPTQTKFKTTPAARRRRGFQCGGVLRALALIKRLEKEGKL